MKMHNASESFEVRGGIFANVNLELTEVVKHIANQMTHWIPVTIEVRGMPGDVMMSIHLNAGLRTIDQIGRGCSRQTSMYLMSINNLTLFTGFLSKLKNTFPLLTISKKANFPFFV